MAFIRHYGTGKQHDLSDGFQAVQESDRWLQPDRIGGRNKTEAELPAGEQATAEGQLQREASKTDEAGKKGEETA
jgi:hypothetical protein